MEIKKFIDIHVPISVCNLKCHYCYVTQSKLNNKEKTIFRYSPEIVRKALSKKRLGGICHFNVCGLGETLIPSELIDYIKGILLEGHTVMIVTNGTLTERFKEYCNLPSNLKSRLGFKFSFHYLELKRTNKMKTFIDNVNMVKDAGISYSIEITPNDEYEKYIEDIKKICLDNFGALPHVSVPRDETKKGIDLLSKHTINEFKQVWSGFDSNMFNFKINHWGQKRKEYCYAGLWSGLLNLGDGHFSPCYCQKGYGFNFFEDLDKSLKMYPVGKCKVSHCYNAHSFLAFGTIPNIDEVSYFDIRNRITKNGDNWINNDLAEQFNSKLKDSNELISKHEKLKYIIKRKKLFIVNCFKKIARK